jgi:hypothetical protein
VIQERPRNGSGWNSPARLKLSPVSSVGCVVPLKVEMRKIIRAEVVPWEVADAEGEEDLYGVAYTTAEGQEEGEPVGTKAEAERVVQEIADQKVVAFNTALTRADG